MEKSSIDGAGRRIGMSTDRLRIGIIGCGALGAVHAVRFSQIEGVVVTALSDPDMEAVNRTAGKLEYRPRTLTTDYRELLDSGLDAVCIASPNAFHVPQILDALAANLHVLCEKPLTNREEEVEAVVASCREVRRHVSLTYPRRYDGGTRALRQEILSGRWGRVKTVTIYNAEDWVTPNRGTWRHDPAICPGGFFYDASGHQIDLVLWVTGKEAVEVRAKMENRGTPVPMVIWGDALLTDDTPCSFAFVGDALRWREQINIHCEGMDFIIEDARVYWLQDGAITPLPPVEPEENGDMAFIKLIRGEGRNWSPPEEVLPLLRFTRAALQSAAEGGAAMSI
jgi:predicted dehydrogenase